MLLLIKYQIMKPLDRKRLEREISVVGDSPVPIHLSIRRFPGFWVAQPLPDGIDTPDKAENYARKLAVEKGVKVCLSTQDFGTVCFDASGMVASRTHGKCGG
jgi:hypothetical protein